MTTKDKVNYGPVDGCGKCEKRMFGNLRFCIDTKEKADAILKAEDALMAAGFVFDTGTVCDKDEAGTCVPLYREWSLDGSMSGGMVLCKSARQPRAK